MKPTEAYVALEQILLELDHDPYDEDPRLRGVTQALKRGTGSFVPPGTLEEIEARVEDLLKRSEAFDGIERLQALDEEIGLALAVQFDRGVLPAELVAERTGVDAADVPTWASLALEVADLAGCTLALQWEAKA